MIKKTVNIVNVAVASVPISTFISMLLRSTLLAGSMPSRWVWKVMIADSMLKLTARSNLPACFCICASDVFAHGYFFLVYTC